MRRNLVAFGALALGWLAGPASAQELIPTPPLPSHVISNNEPPTALPSGPAGGGAATQAPAATTATPAATIVGSPTYWDNAGCCDDHGGRGWRIYAGADALYLRPHFNNNPGLTPNTSTQAFADTGVNTVITSRNTNSTQDFVYDWSVSPRIWIGIENCNGLGVRGRYFRFDQSADPQTAAASASGTAVSNPAAGTASQSITSTNVGTPFFNVGGSGNAATVVAGGVQTTTITPVPDPVFASSSLRLDIYDIEATQAWRGDRWNVILSGGARYAYLQQNSTFFHPGVVTTNTVAGVLANRSIESDVAGADQTFNGAGPMVALEVDRKLGCSGFSLFGSARGALLFGRSRTQSQSASLDIDQNINAAGAVVSQFTFVNGNSSSTSRFDLLPILELETGVQWTRTVGDYEVFIRGAGVAQVYFDGGNPQSRSFDFGLFGAVATVGFRF